MTVRLQGGPYDSLELNVSDAAFKVFVHGIPLIWIEGDETPDGKSWHCYRLYCLRTGAGVELGTGYRYIGTVTRNIAEKE
jgi:hypothetical protein